MANDTRLDTISTVSAEERQQLALLAYRFCWNPSDAEDAVQNALLSATQKAEQLRDADKRWPWLCRIVIQHCHLLQRKEQHHTNCGRNWDLARQKPPAPSPDADQRELGELMKRLLIHLPEKPRIAVTLRHLERMEYPQIAEVMGVSESTARTHVHTGRELLRRLIQSRHPEWQV